MSSVRIEKKIKKFNKNLTTSGDKSLSIRWALLASQSPYKSKSYNLLTSEDVLDTLRCLRKLGVKIKLRKKFCEIFGVGLNGFKYKKNLSLNAGNSGTLGRLIMGLLVHCKESIKLKGDKSLSKRDFLRVSKPLEKFGAKFQTNSGKLPIYIKGTDNPLPINYNETRGSAQCKSSVMLAALNTKGLTTIKAKKSRDHSELLFKYLKLPIKVSKKRNYDLIRIKGKKKIPSINLCIITCLILISKFFANFLNRSWVRGRGGSMFFSNAIAIDCASKPPITIGSFLSPSFSSRISAYAPFCDWLYDILLTFNSIKLMRD